MKLILTAEVDHLGAAGDTVEVKDGYGRNFLLPRGLAIVATRGAQKHADEIRKSREAKTVHDREHADELKAAIVPLIAAVAERRDCGSGTDRRVSWLGTQGPPTRRPGHRREETPAADSLCPRR